MNRFKRHYRVFRFIGGSVPLPPDQNATGIPVITGTATEGETLTCDTTGISDPDGIGTLSYQWLRDDVGISGATSSTYVLVKADSNTMISVYVTYTDGYGNPEGPLVSEAVGPVANVNSDPVGVPTISGSAIEDQYLTAVTSGISDADGLGDFTYQWRSAGGAVGTDSTTYQVQASDIGNTITVEVTYTDGFDTAEGPLVSDATATVTASGSVPVITFEGIDPESTTVFKPATLSATESPTGFWLTESITLPDTGTGETAAYWTTTTGIDLGDFDPAGHTIYAHAENAIGFATPVSLLIVARDVTAPTVGAISAVNVISDFQLNVVYGASSDAESGLYQVRLLISDDGVTYNQFELIDHDGGTYNHTGLVPNQKVYYIVEAEDFQENIAQSSADSGTTSYTPIVGIALTDPQITEGLVLDDPVVTI